MFQLDLFSHYYRALQLFYRNINSFTVHRIYRMAQRLSGHYYEALSGHANVQSNAS
jgi:hypothetical protein